MAIIYVHKETGEPIARERWGWVAKYVDGSELHQFEIKDGKAFFHKFAEIDQSRLAVFEMVSTSDKKYSLLFEPDRMKLMHGYRTLRSQELLADGTHVALEERRAYMFGYEDISHGNKFFIFIMPDDTIVASDDRDKVAI